MARVPIKPELLRWALQDVGLSEGDLQVLVDKPHDEVRAWLDGTRGPHLGELRKIAKATGRSPYFFLRSATPSASNAKVARRTALGVPEEASPDEKKAVEAADQIRALASWLARAEGRPGPDWPDLKRDSPHQSGSALREWLGIDVREDQVNLGSKTAVYSRLRQLCEQRGLVVIQIEFGKTAPQGFSLPDPISPVIVVNSSYDLRSVRSYTLLHELCHLAMDQPSFSHDGNDGFERWAEATSAGALIPSDDLRHYLKTYRKLDKVLPGDLDTVRLVSRRYGASWLATAIRLEELQIAPSGLVANARGGELPEKGFARGGMGRAERRVQEFGTTFPSLLMEGADDGKVSSLDVRRYLRLTSSTEMQAVRSLAAVSS